MNLQRKRPVGITLLGGLFIAAGGLSVLSFCILAVRGGERHMWQTMHATLAARIHTPGLVTVTTLLTFVLWIGFDLYWIAVGLGLLRLQRWAWRIVAALMWLDVISSCVLAAAGHQYRSVVLVCAVPGAICGAILFYLYRPGVRQAFSSRSAAVSLAP